MIRTSKAFAALAPLLQVALVSFLLGLVFALIQLWTLNATDDGLEGASVESARARVVSLDSFSLMTEDLDSGERRQLKEVRGLTRWVVERGTVKGQVLELTYLRDYLLSGSFNGAAVCVALCSNALECQENRRERESSLAMLLFAWGTTLGCLVLHGLRLRASKTTPLPPG